MKWYERGRVMNFDLSRPSWLCTTTPISFDCMCEASDESIYHPTWLTTPIQIRNTYIGICRRHAITEAKLAAFANKGESVSKLVKKFADKGFGATLALLIIWRDFCVRGGN